MLILTYLLLQLEANGSHASGNSGVPKFASAITSTSPSMRGPTDPRPHSPDHSHSHRRNVTGTETTRGRSLSPSAKSLVQSVSTRLSRATMSLSNVLNPISDGPSKDMSLSSVLNTTTHFTQTTEPSADARGKTRKFSGSPEDTKRYKQVRTQGPTFPSGSSARSLRGVYTTGCARSGASGTR